MQSGFFISSSNCSNSINGRQAGSHVISLFSSVQLSSVQFNSARQQQQHKLLATCRFHRQQHQLQEFINRSFNNRVNCSSSVQFSPQHHDYSVKSLSSISSNQKQPHSPYNCEYVRSHCRVRQHKHARLCLGICIFQCTDGHIICNKCIQCRFGSSSPSA